MHKVWNNVVEHPLIVRHHNECRFFGTKGTHTIGHDLQGVDVEAGVGFIKDGQTGLQYGHLKNLVALLLSARKSVVHRSLQKTVVNLQQLHFVLHQEKKVSRIHRFFTAMGPERIQGCFQKIGVADTRDFNRILEGHEQPCARPLLWIHFEEVLASKPDLPAGHFVGLPTGQDLCQGALARPIGSHDGMHFAGLNGEIDSPKDLIIFYSCP